MAEKTAENLATSEAKSELTNDSFEIIEKCEATLEDKPNSIPNPGETINKEQELLFNEPPFDPLREKLCRKISEIKASLNQAAPKINSSLELKIIECAVDDFVVLERERESPKKEFDESIHLIEEEVNTNKAFESSPVLRRKLTLELEALKQLEKQKIAELAMLVETEAAADASSKKLLGLNFAREILGETTEILKKEEAERIKIVVAESVDSAANALEISEADDNADLLVCAANVPTQLAQISDPVSDNLATERKEKQVNTGVLNQLNLDTEISAVNKVKNININYDNNLNFYTNTSSTNNVVFTAGSSSSPQINYVSKKYLSKADYNAPAVVESSGFINAYAKKASVYISYNDSNCDQTQNQNDYLVNNPNTSKIADNYLSNYFKQSANLIQTTNERSKYYYNNTNSNLNTVKESSSEYSPKYDYSRGETIEVNNNVPSTNNNNLVSSTSNYFLKQSNYISNNSRAEISSGNSANAANYASKYYTNSNSTNINTNYSNTANAVNYNSNTANYTSKTDSSDIDSKIKSIMCQFDSKFKKIHDKLENVNTYWETNNANLIVAASNQTATPAYNYPSKFVSGKGAPEFDYSYYSEADKTIIASGNENINTTLVENDLNFSENKVLDTSARNAFSSQAQGYYYNNANSAFVNKYICESDKKAEQGSKPGYNNTNCNSNPNTNTNFDSYQTKYHTISKYTPDTESSSTATEKLDIVSQQATDNNPKPSHDHKNTYYTSNIGGPSESEVISTGFSAAYYKGANIPTSSHISTNNCYKSGKYENAYSTNTQTSNSQYSNFLANIVNSANSNQACETASLSATGIFSGLTNASKYLDAFNYYKKTNEAANLDFNSSSNFNYVTTSNYSDYSNANKSDVAGLVANGAFAQNKYYSSSNYISTDSAVSSEKSKYEEKLNQTLDAIKIKKQTQPTANTSNIEQMLANAILTKSYFGNSESRNVGFGNTKDSEAQVNTSGMDNQYLNVLFKGDPKGLEEFKKNYGNVYNKLVGKN